MRASEESRCAIHPEMLVCSFDDEIVVIIRREQRVSAANAAQEPAASPHHVGTQISRALCSPVVVPPYCVRLPEQFRAPVELVMQRRAAHSQRQTPAHQLTARPTICSEQTQLEQFMSALDAMRTHAA